MKPVAYYKDREQTYLKHFFLERYLEAVAYHIGYSQKEFVYVDCFSGPWRAEDEELGDTSIRIALDRLNSVRNGLAQRQKYPSIRAIFVEKSPSAFATLKQVLQEPSRRRQDDSAGGKFRRQRRPHRRPGRLDICVHFRRSDRLERLCDGQPAADPSAREGRGDDQLHVRLHQPVPDFSERRQ
jgi:hypothetical protein